MANDKRTKAGSPAKKRASRLLPKHRLLTVIAGPALDEVRDPLLRSWTDTAMAALRHLLTAARLDARFELVHQWVGPNRHIHVDSKSKILRASDLCEPDRAGEVSAADAGDLLVKQARAELVQLIRRRQGVALNELLEAASRVRVPPEQLHDHVGRMVQTSPGGRMDVQTHNGEYTLMLRVEGMDVEEEELAIEGQVFRAGNDHVLVRPIKAHRDAHTWLRRLEKVRFADSVATKKALLKLYRRTVLQGATIRIVVRRYWGGARKRRLGLFVDKPWTMVSKARPS